MTPDGRLTTMHIFDGTDGANPAAGLALGTDGNFYGTTWNGGASGLGVVYKLTPNGTFTLLHSFAGPPGDGAYPLDPLTQGTDGNYYGTASFGGNGCVYGDCGTSFKITPGGILTTFYNFDIANAGPYGGLVQGTDGDFYGTTHNGGAYGDVFKISPTETLAVLHNFNEGDGYRPYAGLIQAKDGNFYGTTPAGGIGNGNVFKITRSGTFTDLLDFDGTHGANPYAGLVQGTDSNLYGTTDAGGSSSSCGYFGCGTVFQITTAGVLTVLHNFDGTDGKGVSGWLVQHTNGKFYGTTTYGGTNSTGCNGSGCGTVFSLDMGLGPFVKTVPTSRKVGDKVDILGTSLTGASSVTFNGIAAAFTVVSDTYISTTVPAGATTGPVRVVVPSGTLSTYVDFHVRPVIAGFMPASGPVGTSVVITGSSFTGAISVAFGGVKATSFTVDSYNQITAIVPAGAVTGRITVTTHSGRTLSSGVFAVTP